MRIIMYKNGFLVTFLCFLSIYWYRRSVCMIVCVFSLKLYLIILKATVFKFFKTLSVTTIKNDFQNIYYKLFNFFYRDPPPLVLCEGTQLLPNRTLLRGLSSLRNFRQFFTLNGNLKVSRSKTLSRSFQRDYKSGKTLTKRTLKSSSLISQILNKHGKENKTK